MSTTLEAPTTEQRIARLVNATSELDQAISQQKTAKPSGDLLSLEEENKQLKFEIEQLKQSTKFTAEKWRKELKTLQELIQSEQR